MYFVFLVNVQTTWFLCLHILHVSSISAIRWGVFRYGRYNTVRQLLDSEKGTFIINEGDGEGMTPLHIASQQGHTRLVQLLLNRGALLHRDHNGRNPLHLAAMSGYTQTIEMLLSVHSHLLDQQDKDGVRSFLNALFYFYYYIQHMHVIVQYYSWETFRK